MITGFIRGQRLTLCTPPVAAGTRGSIPARFVFVTCGWDGLIRFAHFRREEDGIERILALGEDGRAEVNPDLSAGDWTVWVHGDAVTDGEISARMTTETVRQGSAEALVRVGELLSDCEAALAEALAQSREAVDLRLAENEAEMLRTADVLRNRTDGSLLPVRAGSEKAFGTAGERSVLWIFYEVRT